MINKIIRNFVAKQVAGRSDDGIMITLKDPQKVEFQTAMMQELLMRRGIDPMAIQSEAQLNMIINRIKAMEKAEEAAQSGIRNTESAKVFNIEGQSLDPNKPIIGGTQTGKELSPELSERLAGTNTERIKQKIADRKIESDEPPPGSRGGVDDIAAPVQSAEETLKNMIMTENKKNIANMRQRKMLEEAIDDASPGFSGDRKVDADLVAENLAERMGLVYDDMPTKERLKLYDEAYTALTKKKFDLPEDLATGGRVGFKGGLSKLLKEFMERRKFLKTMVGNTEKNKRARELEMLKETMEKARENPGFEFPSGKELRTEIEKKIGPILLKDRKLNADGGRIGLKSGTGITDRLVRLLGGKNMAAAELGLEGLNQIYQLLQMPGLYAKGGRAGFFMGSKFPKGLGTLREMVKFFSKGKDKERSGSEILRLVNPKQFNRLLEDPNIYRKFDVQQGIGAPELIKNMQADLAKNRTMMVEEILGAAKNLRKADLDTMERKNEIVKEMIERGIDRETAEEMANTILRMAEATAGMKSTPKLTDEGILELENILKNMETGGKKKRDLNADGGRIGLKDGMNRRTFLKLFAGLASLPIIGKIIKPLKTVKGVKNVPIIKTDDVPGKPEWFDQLVNKVIIEGDDVTKRFATVDRETVHMKKLDDDNQVLVYQDVDAGTVRVEYDSSANTFEDTVQLQYKKPLPDEGDPRPTGEFTTAESGPVGRADGPDDYSIEIDEVGGTSIRDLDSDVSKLKEYATGQKPTMREFIQNKKRKDRAKKITEDSEAQSDAIIRRQGDYDGSDYQDYASGGIAAMLGE